MITLISRRFQNRLGRRGAMLLLLGLVHILIGVGVFIRPPVTTRGSFLTLVPEPIQAAAWVLCGIVAVVWAFRRLDYLGWLALYVMPSLRVLTYAGAWAVYIISGGTDGAENAWYTAVLHLPLILAVLICSGWREYRPVAPTDPART